MRRTFFLCFLAIAPAVWAADPDPVSEKELADSNNPLSSLNSVNFQNYYTPSIYDLPDKTANTLNLRGVKVFGRQIIRGTMPIVSQPNAAGINRSGLGDFNIFD